MELKSPLKSFLKNLLGRPDLKFSNSNSDNFSPALKTFVFENPVSKSPDLLPPRKDSRPYNDAIAKMEPAYNFFAHGVREENPGMKEIFEYDNFHSGTPLRHAPFRPCLKNMRRTLRSKNLHWYPRTPGGYYSQQHFLDYLEKEGFDLAPSGDYDGIGVDNVVFTCSTTHAYSLVLHTIARENDVILMPAPNYGLFAIMTELGNYHLETIDLKPEDDWFVNPDSLARRIDEINKNLKSSSKDKENPPRVAAFLNLNPHNPIGNVMNRKNAHILEAISDVCLEKGVFMIDDLVYRDLSYDYRDPALPAASYKKYFNNTISLFGLSKSYNLASIRAAVVLAPLPVARMITSELHDTMDSVPVLQVSATVGAFNGSPSRYRRFYPYIRGLISEYNYRFELLSALVYGIKSVKDRKLRARIARDISRYAKSSDRALLLSGCKGIKIKFRPESGFFAVFDFTELKGKSTPEGKIISDENSLLSFFYSRGGVKYLMGGNIFWTNPDELVGRISFALEKRAIISNMLILNKASRELKK